MDGCILVHPVMDADAGEIPLPEAQGRARTDAVDGHALGGLSRDVDRLPGDGQIVFDRCSQEKRGSGEHQEDQRGNGRVSDKASHKVTLLSQSESPITETERKPIAPRGPF